MDLEKKYGTMPREEFLVLHEGGWRDKELYGCGTRLVQRQ